MPPSPTDYSWLPDRQLHAALTLGHADASIQRLGEILHDYLLPPGPFALGEVRDGNVSHLTVTGIAPLPAGISRHAADVLTQLRAVVEHTLYAEVEAGLGRELDASEQRRIEMPALTKPEDFPKWLKMRQRPDLEPLRLGSHLVERIRSLQPFCRRDSDNHPLRVLAEHSNLAKHRTPAVATVRVGRVHTWPLDHPEVVVSSHSGAAVEAGTILATVPIGQQIPINIWPMVAIQRPHTGEWKVIVRELGDLEEWVRTVAVPVLVTGDAGAAPLPPQIDTKTGWDEPRVAIRSGRQVPAAQRYLNRIQARAGRTDLVETLALHPQRAESGVIEQWVNGLDDDGVLAQLDKLQSASARGPQATADACLTMIQTAQLAVS